MFQTSDDDKWLISLFARHVSRPTTSSLYAEVYKRLPNDTDFTVFKKHGIEGYNFAFVRYEQNYHTKNDNFANADPGSLQHHGQNAWPLLTAIADLDLAQRSPGRAIYCDVLAMFVVWWPASINFGLAVGILAVTLAAGLIARRRGLFLRFKWRVFLSVAAPLFAGALAVWWMGIRGDFHRQPAAAHRGVLAFSAACGLCGPALHAAWKHRNVECVGGRLALLGHSRSRCRLVRAGSQLSVPVARRDRGDWRAHRGVFADAHIFAGVLGSLLSRTGHRRSALAADSSAFCRRCRADPAAGLPVVHSLVTVTALPLLAREISPTIPQVAVAPLA